MFTDRSKKIYIFWDIKNSSFVLNVLRKLLIDIYERSYKIIVNGKYVVAARTFLSDKLYKKFWNYLYSKVERKLSR